MVALVAYSGIAGSTGALRVDLQLKTGTADWALVGEANSNSAYQTCALSILHWSFSKLPEKVMTWHHSKEGEKTHGANKGVSTKFTNKL